MDNICFFIIYKSNMKNIPKKFKVFSSTISVGFDNERLNLSGVVNQRELLFCGGCGDKRQLIVETDINSQRVCKNKLCKQNNCG
jgi:hypothetical protein